MLKDIYLIRGDKVESYEDFKYRLLEKMHSISNLFDKIKLTLTEKKPPSISIIPFRKSKIAAISVFYSSERKPERSLINLEGFVGAYKVTEALPVAYKKDWKDGEVTPGICMLTLFRKKKNINYDTFINRWHNGHTPLSLKIHPLWHYNRNVVNQFLINNSEKCDGIVEEHCRTQSELLNPFKFFGNPFIIIPRMIEVYSDVNSFLDYPSIEPYLVSEYYIKS